VRTVATAPETPSEILARIPPLPAVSEAAEALRLAREQVLASPGKADAWLRLGESLAQAQRSSNDAACYDHAETAYRRALELAPRSVEAMTGLAWVFGGRHRFAWSVEWAKRALAIDADHHPAHGILGDAALEQGDYEAAFGHYQTMMDLRPDLSSWSRGAHLLWLTGHKTQAIALMERAIRSGAPFAENTAWCRVRLATMLLHDGALVPAAQALAPALKSLPENPQVLLAAGRIATAQDDLAGAQRYFEKVLERGANHDALVALGDLCLARGDRAAAEEYFARVDQLHATNRAAGIHDHTSMAKFLADHDRRLDEALKLAEEHRETLNVLEADVLAWVCYKTGDLPRAAATMKKALSQHTPDPEMHFHAGMIAAASGDRPSAQRHLQTALSLNPRFHPLHATSAREALETLGTSRLSTGN
jgi:tetratricopeptide (TPR) repeat protein